MKQIGITLLTKFMEVILGMLAGDELKRFADFMLDKVEEFAKKSDTKIDDATVLPLCALLRKVFSVPDFNE